MLVLLSIQKLDEEKRLSETEYMGMEVGPPPLDLDV
jgi:hypothetical protein